MVMLAFEHEYTLLQNETIPAMKAGY